MDHTIFSHGVQTGVLPLIRLVYAAMGLTLVNSRNAALGHSDGNDRGYPELVNVPRGKYDERKTASAKFHPLQVKALSMSKLHTGRRLHPSD